MPVTINLNDVQVKPIVVNADLTAVLDRTYTVVASAIFTDPTPTEGKGFIVFVRNGTATVGGIGYSTAGTIIRRVYYSGAWANYTGTSVDVNTIGVAINGASSATPNDTDLVMSVDTSVAKKNTWTQIKAFLKTYFDTVYQAAGTYLTSANITQTITNGVTDKAPSEDAVYDALALKVNATDDRLETIKTIFNHTTTISHTGNTNETYLTGYDITGKFEANDFWMTRWRIAATNNANAKTFRMYVNDTNDLAGTPVLIGTYAPSSNVAGFGVFEREVVFKNSLASQEVNLTTGNLGTDTGSSNNTFSSLTIDFSTGNKFLVISVQLANSADTATLRHGRSNIFR